MAESNPKRVYTQEEVAKLCPSYKGRPENFRPGKKSAAAQNQSRRGPATPNVTPPSALSRNTNPTPQKNEPLYEDAVFGVDVSVVELNPLQVVTPNLSHVVGIADNIYNEWSVDDQMLGRKMCMAEMRYYATAMTWLRIIDLKAKQGRSVLTSAEKDIRKATEHLTFNVPAPLNVFLSSMGAVSDKSGKRTEPSFPVLPVVVSGNRGGYHAAAVDVDSHVLFEEIPTLGIMGDVLMAAADPAQQANVSVGVTKPHNVASFNDNLLGFTRQVSGLRPEVKQNLQRYGITSQSFEEYVPNTRFNLKYLSALSATIGLMETFKIEKIMFANLSSDGTMVMAIKTQPDVTVGLTKSWRNRTVQALSPEASSASLMGAATYTGFQLYKENGDGANASEQRSKWCCLNTDHADWPIPDGWFDNRNIRRDMPPGIATSRFGSVGLDQEITRDAIIRRLVKTTR